MPKIFEFYAFLEIPIEVKVEKERLKLQEKNSENTL
jgi:hypothetical protein